MYFEQLGENNNQTIAFLHGSQLAALLVADYPELLTAHNIPPMFYKSFNECIEQFMDKKSV